LSITIGKHLNSCSGCRACRAWHAETLAKAGRLRKNCSRVSSTAACPLKLAHRESFRSLDATRFYIAWSRQEELDTMLRIT